MSSSLNETARRRLQESPPDSPFSQGSVIWLPTTKGNDDDSNEKKKRKSTKSTFFSTWIVLRSFLLVGVLVAMASRIEMMSRINSDSSSNHHQISSNNFFDVPVDLSKKHNKSNNDQNNNIDDINDDVNDSKNIRVKSGNIEVNENTNNNDRNNNNNNNMDKRKRNNKNDNNKSKDTTEIINSKVSKLKVNIVKNQITNSSGNKNNKENDNNNMAKNTNSKIRIIVDKNQTTTNNNSININNSKKNITPNKKAKSNSNPYDPYTPDDWLITEENDADFQNKRPFPRWGSGAGDGISLAPVLQFLNSKLPKSKSAVAAPEVHPQILYILDHRGVWVSEELRGRATPIQFGRRYQRERNQPTEQSMLRAWEILTGKDTSGESQGLPPPQERWPQLYKHIIEGQGAGFPFIALYSDGRMCNYKNFEIKGRWESIPIFSTCGKLNCNHAFPIPSYKLLTDGKPRSRDWETIMANYSIAYPWQEKIKQVVWRGALTGDIGKYLGPRARIGRFGAAHRPRNATNYRSSIFDIGLTRVPIRHKDAVIDMERTGGLVDPINPMDDFQKYIGILDIDGNSWSSRFGILLCYNSVILKVDPHYVDYFHLKYLEAWKHYVPVKYDLSDLEEKARYVVNPKNAKQMKSIVRNANEWCRNHMTFPAMDRDLLDIWETYINYLDKGDPDWRNFWKEESQKIFKENDFKMGLVRRRTGKKVVAEKE